jgi:hypothetical protein
MKPKEYQPWEICDQVQRFCGPDFPLVSRYDYDLLMKDAEELVEVLRCIELDYQEYFGMAEVALAAWNAKYGEKK